MLTVTKSVLNRVDAKFYDYNRNPSSNILVHENFLAS